MQVSFRSLDGLVSDIKPEIPTRQRTIVSAKRIHLHTTPTPPPAAPMKRKLVRKSCIVTNVQVKTPTIPHKKKTRKTAHIESPIFSPGKENKSILGISTGYFNPYISSIAPSVGLQNPVNYPSSSFNTAQKPLDKEQIDIQRINIEPKTRQKIDTETAKIDLTTQPIKIDLSTPPLNTDVKIDLTTPKLNPVELPVKHPLGLVQVEKKAPVEKINLAAQLLMDRQTIPKKPKKRPKSPELITESPKPKKLNQTERKEIREFIKSKKLQEKDKELEKETQGKLELERKKKNLEILNLKRKLRLDMNVKKKIEMEKKVKDEEIQTDLKKGESIVNMADTISAAPVSNQRNVPVVIPKPKTEDSNLTERIVPVSNVEPSTQVQPTTDSNPLVHNTVISGEKASPPKKEQDPQGERVSNIVDAKVSKHENSPTVTSSKVLAPIEKPAESELQSATQDIAKPTPKSDPRIEKFAQQIQLLQQRVKQKLDKNEIQRMEQESKAGDMHSATGLIEKMNFLATLLIKKQDELKSAEQEIVIEKKTKEDPLIPVAKTDGRVGELPNQITEDEILQSKEDKHSLNPAKAKVEKVVTPTETKLEHAPRKTDSAEHSVQKPIIPSVRVPIIPQPIQLNDSQVGIGSLQKFDFILHQNKQRNIAAVKIQAFYKRKLKRKINHRILDTGLVQIEQRDSLESVSKIYSDASKSPVASEGVKISSVPQDTGLFQSVYRFAPKTEPKENTELYGETGKPPTFEPDQYSMFNLFAKRVVYDKQDNIDSVLQKEKPLTPKVKVTPPPIAVTHGSVVVIDPKGATEGNPNEAIANPNFSQSIHYSLPLGPNFSFKDDISSITSDYNDSEYSENFEQLSESEIKLLPAPVPSPKKEMEPSESYDHEESYTSSVSTTSSKSSPPIRNFNKLRNSKPTSVKDDLLTPKGRLDPTSIGLK
ncbi:hypothetical protein HDV01_004196 [Terramyces sp. JEL0728]|nr:hypothetical protein HDV01_004196 [Terramyces sp. JEL0728]